MRWAVGNLMWREQQVRSLLCLDGALVSTLANLHWTCPTERSRVMWIALVMWTIIYNARYQLPYMFSNDSAVVSLTSSVLVLVAIAQVCRLL